MTGLLARWLPGLDVVRVPERLYTGGHLALGLLAGLGAAGLLRATPARFSAAAGAPRRARPRARAPRPAFLGFEPRLGYVPVTVRPSFVRTVISLSMYFSYKAAEVTRSY